MPPALIELRQAEAQDDAFLYTLYASTRQEEISAWGWDTHQQDVFLRMQYSAQRQYYHGIYPHAENELILKDGAPIGRILTAWLPGQAHLVDIALLPEHRGQGTGSELLSAFLAQAAQRGLPVSLNVLRTSPAQRLYQRLGFSPSGGDDLYLEMVWRPE